MWNPGFEACGRLVILRVVIGELVPRRAERLVVDALDVFRVVIVNGPRQAGKSTLLGRVATEGPLVTLDDRATLRAARTDPTGFVDGYPKPLRIDEIQRGGDPLILAIKADVDREHTSTGRYLLAGSSRFLTVPQLSESLAGRARIIDLWPLSQSEIERTADTTTLVDHLFGTTASLRALDPPVCQRDEVLERLVEGGFPSVLRISSQRARGDWFDDYVTTLIRRDLTELSRIRQAVDLPRLLALLAARTSAELNIAALARDAQLGEDATRAYLALLETLYLIFQLPAWSTSATTRAKRRMKLHFVDSGIAANLLGATVDSLRIPTAAHTGPLLETFVASECARLSTWSATRCRLSHFRDQSKREVDLVLEGRDGRVAAVEVKAALDVDESDFRHLAYLRDRLGERFANGVVLHLGQRPLPFGDRLTSLPVSALWA